jgi:hypothetical protein
MTSPKRPRRRIDAPHAGKVRVSGTVTRIEPYCGGAAPGEDDRNPRYPWSGTLHLREGDRNREGPIVAEIEVDGKGSFTTELAADRHYCLVSGDKLLTLPKALEAAQARPNPFGLDLACVERQWRHCDRVLQVGSTRMRDVEILFLSRCGYEMPCAIDPPAPPPSIER